MSQLLHLPFDNLTGAPGLILDVSAFQAIFTKFGGAGLSSSQSKFGGSSCVFNTSSFSDNLYLSTSQYTHLALSGAFTVQFWVYPLAFGATYGSPVLDTRTTADAATGSSSTGLLLFYGATQASNHVKFQMLNASVESDTVLGLSTWSHVAVTRDTSNVVRMFINGSRQSGTASIAGVVPCSQFIVGRYVNGTGSNGSIRGYLDDLEIRDECLYTDTFVPPPAIPYSFALSVRRVGRLLTQAGNAVPDAAAGRLRAVAGTHDIYFGGAGKIVNQCAIKGSPNTPVKRRIRLHDRDSGLLIAETWSAADGNYQFRNLDRSRSYYAVAFDHLGVYEGVVADRLVPVAM